MDFCIAVNAQNNVGGSAFSQRQANDYSNGYRQRFLYSRARHCTAVDHGVSLVLGNGVFTGFCQVVNCVLKNTSATTDAVQVTLADSNNTNWIDSDNNAWHIAKSNGWWIDNQGVVTSNTFAAWQALGRDPNSIAATINMVDSTYDMGDHSAAEGGPSTTADFLTALRNRGRTTWSDLYSARAAYDNFSAAYAVTSLPAIDLTADGYYGHYDYRSGLPVFFTITGPDELELDELGTFTITPSGPPDATVQVSDDGAPSGTMNPQNVIWSAAEQDGRTFDYTPKDADGGSRTITADIAGDVVAIKVVTVTDPEEPPIPPPSGGLVSSAEWRW
jgi:hypothetical protein